MKNLTLECFFLSFHLDVATVNVYVHVCACVQDYFNVIKKPIDLSVIKKKLDDGQYSDPWQFVDDMWLMFNNAWLYNRKTSRVYKFCTKVSCR